MKLQLVKDKKISAKYK